MKKPTVNKSTLLLAVACWCFYFWKKDRDIETIAFHQNIINEALYYETDQKNNLFLEEVKDSWYNHIMYFDDKKKPKTEDFEAKLYKSAPDVYGRYLSSLENVSNELLYYNKFYTDEKLDFTTIYLNEFKGLFNSDKKEERKKDLALISERLNYVQRQSPLFEKANFHKIDWNESNDLNLWLDIIKHKKEVIELTNSIFKENKKSFPTSFESNHFEGYSTLIPDYENQKMIVKVFYFQSDTKYGTDFQKRREKYGHSTPDNAFRLGDSTFYSMQSPRTYHIFEKVGDTTLQFYFLDKETREYFAQYSPLYDISFKVIPKK
ncbi:hypothetical protein [Bernardetia sp. MNP-M8]|uniref:hypothetical protein n=1 Tax=Bernardetia sp. MNP-M8 TaxID=3127470 RepID=UPI0030D342AC